MKSLFRVYAIKFEGEVIYVGQTSQYAEKRLTAHFAAAKKWLKENRPSGGIKKLYDHIGSNHKSKYTLEILEFCDTEKESHEKEIKWIAKFNTMEKCNSSCGGDVPRGEDHYLYGVKGGNAKAVAASAAARRGKPISQATRDKLSKAHSGRHMPTRSNAVINVTTGKVYRTAQLASKDLGVSVTTIMKHCRGGKTKIARRDFFVEFYKESTDADECQLGK